jgi:hypothetical protein
LARKAKGFIIGVQVEVVVDGDHVGGKDFTLSHSGKGEAMTMKNGQA